VEQVDDWENLWFPVAKAALGHRYPEVERHLFLNLVQTDGPEVVLTVATFVRRLEALPEQGDEAAAARALLERRGLTSEVVGEAKALLSDIGTIDDADTEPLERALHEDREAETARRRTRCGSGTSSGARSPARRSRTGTCSGASGFSSGSARSS
jgi:hypothetical protein